MTTTQNEKADRFRALHDGPGAFVIPNPWDVGSARILAGLGFPALATSSAASAAALGRIDGCLTRDQAMAHARLIVDATDLPVSADLEKGFGDDPETVAETIRDPAAAGARRTGLATSLYRAAMTGFLDAIYEVRDAGQFGFLDRCVTTAELHQLMRT